MTISRFKKPRRSLVVLQKLALITSATAVVSTAPFAVDVASAAPACAPVALLAFRGSGENNPSDMERQTFPGGATSNGYEGGVLRRLIKQFYADHPEMSSVPILTTSAPEYPAVKVDPTIEGLSGLLTTSPVYNSSVKGVAEGLRQIDLFRFRSPRGCSSTKFVLLGYSQGAMAARGVAAAIPDAIAGTFFYGDPWHRAGAPENIGDGKGNGIFRINYPFSLGDVDKLDAISSFPKRDNCHGEDVICSPGVVAGWNGIAGNTKTHESYFDIPGEAASEAGKVADVVGPYLGITTPTASKASASVAIAIDTTGSMGSYIDQAKRNAIAIADNILNGNPASRVALVEYKDLGDPFVARTVVPPTRDSAGFSAGVQGLSASGGGDTPESVYSGLVEALRDVKSSTSDLKSVIVIGDAPPHDPEPGTGYTASQVSSFFKGTAPVPAAGASARSLRSVSPSQNTDSPSGTRDQAPGRRPASAARELPRLPFVAGPTSVDEQLEEVSLYTLSASSELSGYLRPISDETGGKVLDVSDSSSVITAIDEAVSDATSAPVARIGASPIALTNSDIPLSAAESTGGEGLKFAFDLTGTGVFGSPTDAATTIARFPVPGSYKVSVRVTDARGRTSTASTTINVDAATSAVNRGQTGGAGTGSSSGPLFGSS